MPEFDWEEAKTRHTGATLDWLKANQNTPLTEAEFIEQFRALPHDHAHPSRCRAPSRAANQYRRLKERFGFFNG